MTQACDRAPGVGPLIAVLRADPEELVTLLTRRFGADYTVQGTRSTTELHASVTAAGAAGQQVALVIADLSVAGTSTLPTLASLRDHDPHVIRCVLQPYVDQGAAHEILAALAVEEIDRYFTSPWGEPNIGLYPAVTELLSDWWQAVSREPATPALTVVAPPLSPRTHELRDLLDRNSVPVRFLDSGSAADALRRRAGARAEDVCVQAPSGALLVNPSNRDIADHLGAHTRPSAHEVDLLVVGGGPAGLAAAVYGASEGLRTVVVERAAMGGQAGTSSLIRNYPGFPHGLSGNRLAQLTTEQAWLFGVEFVITNGVTALTPTADGRYRLHLADGTEVTSRAVILALGVDYRRLDVPSLERLVGAGVYYGAARAEAPGFAAKDVYVVGGGNSAGQAAVHLARFASSVTILIRGASLQATMSDYLIQQLARTPSVTVQPHTEVAEAHGSRHLEGLTLRARDGGICDVPAAGLFILIGAQPQTGWLPEIVQRDARGFLLTGTDVLVVGPDGEPANHLDGRSGTRAALPYETSLPGVFAVGDVRAGSIKRVTSAVGEGSVAISFVHQHLEHIGRRSTVGETS